MKSAYIDGIKVTIGDWVGFKADIEQSGCIIDITNSFGGSKVLTLSNPSGMEGEYLRGKTTCKMNAEDCWTD